MFQTSQFQDSPLAHPKWEDFNMKSKKKTSTTQLLAGMKTTIIPQTCSTLSVYILYCLPCLVSEFTVPVGIKPWKREFEVCKSFFAYSYNCLIMHSLEAHQSRKFFRDTKMHFLCKSLHLSEMTSEKKQAEAKVIKHAILRLKRCRSVGWYCNGKCIVKCLRE